MIKLSYGRFMSFPFTQVLQKIAGSQFPIKQAYTIKKLADKMQTERNRISTEYQALMLLYAKKDEKGEVVHPDKNDDGTPNLNSFDVDDAQMEAYKKAETAFGEKEVTFDFPKFSLDSLASLSFSPAEISLLEAVLQDPDEKPEGAVAPVVGQIGPKAGA